VGSYEMFLKSSGNRGSWRTLKFFLRKLQQLKSKSRETSRVSGKFRELTKTSLNFPKMWEVCFPKMRKVTKTSRILGKFRELWKTSLNFAEVWEVFHSSLNFPKKREVFQKLPAFF
jgi:hypothetical protein